MMDMTVPRQVQEQMDLAGAMHAQLYGQAPEEGQPASVDEAPVAEPVAEVAAEPSAVEQVVAKEQHPEQDAEYWKQRFNTVRGKLDAELPLMTQQLRERDNALRDAQARLDALERAKSEQPPVEQKAATDKDVEEFGADLVSMVERVSASSIKQELSRFASELDKRMQVMFGQMEEVRGHVVKSESEKFWDSVTALVPDWEAVDSNPMWHEFLDTTPSFTTETYRNLAAAAIASGKADRIAELVKLWRAPVAEAPATTPVVPSRAKEELRRQVAPSTSKGAAPPAGQKLWTAKEYEYVFSQQAMREVESKNLEGMQAEANAALVEGRVRW
jgi:hypothetical protein